MELMRKLKTVWSSWSLIVETSPPPQPQPQPRPVVALKKKPGRPSKYHFGTLRPGEERLYYIGLPGDRHRLASSLYSHKKKNGGVFKMRLQGEFALVVRRIS